MVTRAGILLMDFYRRRDKIAMMEPPGTPHPTHGTLHYASGLPAPRLSKLAVASFAWGAVQLVPYQMLLAIRAVRHTSTPLWFLAALIVPPTACLLFAVAVLAVVKRKPWLRGRRLALAGMTCAFLSFVTTALAYLSISDHWN